MTRNEIILIVILILSFTAVGVAKLKIRELERTCKLGEP